MVHVPPQAVCTALPVCQGLRKMSQLASRSFYSSGVQTSRLTALMVSTWGRTKHLPAHNLLIFKSTLWIEDTEFQQTCPVPCL